MWRSESHTSCTATPLRINFPPLNLNHPPDYLAGLHLYFALHLLLRYLSKQALAAAYLHLFLCTLQNKHDTPPPQEHSEDNVDIVVHMRLYVAAEFSYTTTEILRSLIPL